MANEKNKLIKQIKDKRNRVYKAFEGGYRAELKSLMDFLNDNPFTGKTINDLRIKYPDVHWNPAEWEHPHQHWDEPEPHEDIYEPTRPDERAAVSLILIDQITSCSMDIDYLHQYASDGYYSQRHKRVTERFIDPLVNYLIDTINSKYDRVEHEVIRSGNKKAGIKKLSEAMKSLEGDIRICDPYTDDTLFIYISKIELEKTKRIRILTDQGKHRKKLSFNINSFKKYCQNFGVQFEMRYFDDVSSPLHDRYILSDSFSYKIGSSMNGLGGRDTEIDPMDKEKASKWADTFKSEWNDAHTYQPNLLDSN